MEWGRQIAIARGTESGFDNADAKMKGIATWLDARTDAQTWRSIGSFYVWNDDAESLRISLDEDSE